MNAIITVRLTPQADRNSVDRVDGETILARVTAPPVKGAANEALLGLLSKALRIPKSAVTIQSGMTRRVKYVEIVGATVEEINARLSILV